MDLTSSHWPIAHTPRKQQFFKTKICPWDFKKRCDRGINCQFAHSEAELRTAPDLCRTSLCMNIKKFGICQLPNCKYAHSSSDLRATVEMLKTTLCVKWQSGRCNAGSSCRHAHGERELRSNTQVSNQLPKKLKNKQSKNDQNRHFFEKVKSYKNNRSRMDSDMAKYNISLMNGNTKENLKNAHYLQLLSKMNLNSHLGKKIFSKNFETGNNFYLRRTSSGASTIDDTPRSIIRKLEGKNNLYYQNILSCSNPSIKQFIKSQTSDRENKYSYMQGNNVQTLINETVSPISKKNNYLQHNDSFTESNSNDSVNLEFSEYTPTKSSITMLPEYFDRMSWKNLEIALASTTDNTPKESLRSFSPLKPPRFKEDIFENNSLFLMKTENYEDDQNDHLSNPNLSKDDFYDTSRKDSFKEDITNPSRILKECVYEKKDISPETIEEEAAKMMNSSCLNRKNFDIFNLQQMKNNNSQSIFSNAKLFLLCSNKLKNHLDKVLSTSIKDTSIVDPEPGAFSHQQFFDDSLSYNDYNCKTVSYPILPNKVENNLIDFKIKDNSYTDLKNHCTVLFNGPDIWSRGANPV